jgi:hypothetical protein
VGTAWLSYKGARFLVPPKTAAFTALLFAFGSPLFPYSTTVAHYSHVYLALAVAVFAAEWPFATHARLRVRSTQKATLIVGWPKRSAPASRVEVPAADAGGDEAWVEIALPEGVFDSGVNEWSLRAEGTGPSGEIVVSIVRPEDRAPRVAIGYVER